MMVPLTGAVLAAACSESAPPPATGTRRAACRATSGCAHPHARRRTGASTRASSAHRHGAHAG